MINEIANIYKRCKAGVFLTINRHKCFYETVEEHIENLCLLDDELKSDIGEDIYRKMVELDTIIDLQFYPDTAVGSYSIYHYDISEAVKIANKILDSEARQ